MSGSDLIVILIVALLFLGPDKLPEATKKISKGIRDLKRQSRALQQHIENDERIGGAIRDLKSALRGDEAPAARPPVRKPVKKKPAGAKDGDAAKPPALAEGDAAGAAADAGAGAAGAAEAHDADAEDKPAVTLPRTAGEAGSDTSDESHADELAAMIKPASGTVAQGEPAPEVEAEPKRTHG